MATVTTVDRITSLPSDICTCCICYCTHAPVDTIFELHQCTNLDYLGRHKFTNLLKQSVKCFMMFIKYFASEIR